MARAPQEYGDLNIAGRAMEEKEWEEKGKKEDKKGKERLWEEGKKAKIIEKKGKKVFWKSDPSQ